MSNPEVNLFSRIVSYIKLETFKISNLRRRKIYFRFLLTIIFIIYHEYIISPNSQNQPFTLFLNILLLYLILDLIFNLLRVFIVSSYRKKNKFQEDFQDNFTIGINKVATIFMGIFFMFGILYFLNIEFVTFLTSLGLFSVALAWIFKEYISNLLDGIVIMFSQNFRIRDYIKIGEYKGRINNISFLNIELKTDEGDIVYIPNSKILNSEVLNYSKVRSKKISFAFEMNQIYYRKVNKIEKIIFKRLIQKFPNLIISEKLYLRIISIKEKTSQINIEIPVKTYNFTIEEEIKKYLSLIIFEILTQNKK